MADKENATKIEKMPNSETMKGIVSEETIRTGNNNAIFSLPKMFRLKRISLEIPRQ